MFFSRSNAIAVEGVCRTAGAACASRRPCSVRLEAGDRFDLGETTAAHDAVTSTHVRECSRIKVKVRMVVRSAPVARLLGRRAAVAAALVEHAWNRAYTRAIGLHVRCTHARSAFLISRSGALAITTTTISERHHGCAAGTCNGVAKT